MNINRHTCEFSIPLTEDARLKAEQEERERLERERLEREERERIEAAVSIRFW